MEPTFQPPLSVQTTSISFPNEKELQKFYPKGKKIERVIKNNDRREINFTYLHHLIVNSKFGVETKFLKEQLTAKNKNFFNVTSLHLAAMRGNALGVSILLDQTKMLTDKECADYINATDNKGWTALHFAALTSEKIYALLKAAGADESIENSMCGTPVNLLKLTGKTSSIFSLSNIVLRISKQKDRSFSDLKPQELEQLGLKEFCDFPIYKKLETWKLLWRDKKEEAKSLLNFFASLAIKKLQTSPPSLCVTLKDNRKSLFANADIKKGFAIGIFAGCVIEHTETPGKFDELFKASSSESKVWGNVNATNEGNAIKFANKGRPNAFMGTFQAIEGTPMSILFAGEDILKGDEILWDYSPSNVALHYGCDPLLGKEKLLTDFSGGFDALFSNFNQIRKTFYQKKEKCILTMEDFSDFMIAEARLFYPLHTPALLIDFHFSGFIVIDLWIDYIKSFTLEINNLGNDFLRRKLMANFLHYTVTYSVIKRIQAFTVFLNEYKYCKKAIEDWFVKKSGKLTVMQLLKAMDIIKTDKDFEGIESYFIKVEDKLKDYDWLKDPDAPLSFERRKEDFEEFKKILPPTIHVTKIIL